MEVLASLLRGWGFPTDELEVAADAGHVAAPLLLILALAASDGYYQCSSSTEGDGEGGVRERTRAAPWQRPLRISRFVVSLGGMACDGYSLYISLAGSKEASHIYGGLAVLSWGFMLAGLAWAASQKKSASLPLALWGATEVASGAPQLVVEGAGAPRIAAMACKAALLLSSMLLRERVKAEEGEEEGGSAEEPPEGGGDDVSHSNLHEESNPFTQLFL